MPGNRITNVLLYLYSALVPGRTNNECRHIANALTLAAIGNLFLMQKDLVDFLLTDLRSRPGMFLTAYSLSYLNIYLTGSEITCWHVDEGGKYLERFSGEKGFVQWSWRKYNLGHPPFKLHHYLEFARGNEQEALDLFFEDLEKYHLESCSS